MAAQYRQLPPDVHKQRQGIIKEADRIKGAMAAAQAAGEDTSAHKAALAEMGNRHERLLAPYKISDTPAAANPSNGGVAKKVAPRAVKLDTAAEDADVIEKAHRAAGGKAVKALDLEAIKAADRDKSWASMSPEDQAAAAKAARPSGVSHSTSTPGGTHQTAMAEAMSKAGMPTSPSQPAIKAEAKESVAASPVPAKAARKVTISDDVAARNNMAVPRGEVDSSVVSGLTGKDSPETLAAARKAATKGSRTSSKAAEEAAARRSSSPRSAASAAPSVRGGQQFARVGDSGTEASSAPGRDWLTPSTIKAGMTTPAPAKNAAPLAPTPSAPSATPAAPTASTATQPPSGGLGEVIGSRPRKGVSPAHMVSSAPDRHWLTPQAANKAKAGKQPKEAVVEAPAAAQPAAKKLGGRSAPSSAAAVGNVNRAPMPSDNEYSSANRAIGGVRHNIGPAMAQNTPMAGPQVERAHAGEVSGARTHVPASGTRSPVTSHGSAGVGRSGAAPRSGEVGGGRVSGGSAGGLHIATEGNSNVYSNIGNTTHVTNVHNYGTMTGNAIGGEGGTPRGPASRGGGGEHPEREGGGGHGQGFNIHYTDSTGHHDLRKGLDHITGRTGGKGERLDQGSKPVVGGGAQKPLKGSVRAPSSGASSPAPETSTGTTHNWTGPIHMAPQSASGNGTATAPQKTVP